MHPWAGKPVSSCIAQGACDPGNGTGYGCGTWRRLTLVQELLELVLGKAWPRDHEAPHNAPVHVPHHCCKDLQHTGRGRGGEQRDAGWPWPGSEAGGCRAVPCTTAGMPLRRCSALGMAAAEGDLLGWVGQEAWRKGAPSRTPCCRPAPATCKALTGRPTHSQPTRPCSPFRRSSPSPCRSPPPRRPACAVCLPPPWPSSACMWSPPGRGAPGPPAGRGEDSRHAAGGARAGLFAGLAPSLAAIETATRCAIQQRPGMQRSRMQRWEGLPSSHSAPRAARACRRGSSRQHERQAEPANPGACLAPSARRAAHKCAHGAHAGADPP